MSDQTGHKVLAEGDGTGENRLMYADDHGRVYDIENLVDALDHIMRVARQANTVTKRLKMIELRAKSALEGTDEWRDYDYPRNRQQQKENLRARLREATDRLTVAEAKNERFVMQLVSIQSFMCAGDVSLPDGRKFAYHPPDDLVRKAWKSLTDAIKAIDVEGDGLRELKDSVAASAGLQCPNIECGDQGWYPQQISQDEWEQIQCEFCYTVDDSIFNRRMAENPTPQDDGS